MWKLSSCSLGADSLGSRMWSGFHKQDFLPHGGESQCGEQGGNAKHVPPVSTAVIMPEEEKQGWDSKTGRTKGSITILSATPVSINTALFPSPFLCQLLRYPCKA